jgi:peptide chain release factor subunit 1
MLMPGSEITSWEKYTLKRKLEELKAYQGRATELISLYIPPTRRISDVAAYLRNEYSQSANIKSKSTRKNVMAAIESILSRLKYFKEPPENGMAFFVGHVAKGADRTEMTSHIVEPPVKLTTFLYRCDSFFYLQPLEELLLEEECYGLIVVDRSEATVGLLRGKRIEPIKNLQSLVPSKHSRGGQSQRRFERLIEIAAHEYFKKVGEVANEAFLEVNDLKGILVGGPGSTKNFFIGGDYLHHELKKKIIDTFDTGYTDEYGLRELVGKSVDALAEIDIMREKKLVHRLMREIRKTDGGLSVYGEAEVRRALQMGVIDVLLLSEALRKCTLKFRCTACDYTTRKSVTGVPTEYEYGECPECSSPMECIEKKDIIEEFSDLAKKVGTDIEMISEDSDEGTMLLRAFGGVAGILRYSPDER